MISRRLSDAAKHAEMLEIHVLCLRDTAGPHLKLATAGRLAGYRRRVAALDNMLRAAASVLGLDDSCPASALRRYFWKSDRRRAASASVQERRQRSRRREDEPLDVSPVDTP